MPSKMMSAMNASISTFKPFELDQAIDGVATDFDVFVWVANEPVLYAAAPYLWRVDELRALKREGMKLCVRVEDVKRVDAYRTLRLVSSIDRSLAPGPRLEQIMDVTAEITRVLFNQNLTTAAVSLADRVCSDLVDCLQEDESCVKLIKQLGSHDLKSYLHSGRTAGFAVAVALNMGVTKRFTLVNIALGSLLHDIGDIRINQALLEKSGPLDPADWSKIHQHTEMGHEEVARCMVGAIPRDIVLHHHEREDGTGYPHQLSSDEIPTEVKIVAVADVFDALTSDRPHRPSKNAFQALELMRHSMGRALNPEVFRALVQALGKKTKEVA
jgi:HD-GYP domain-containing protein (c-di-GMP phosphodiesterase class II)